MSFTAKNVDEDEVAYDELIARGFRTIPVTVAGDRTIIGFDRAALTALVQSLSDRTADRTPSA